MQVERQFVGVRTRQVVIDLPPPMIWRQPHPAIAGKGRLIGDLVQPVVEEGDWDCLA